LDNGNEFYEVDPISQYLDVVPLSVLPVYINLMMEQREFGHDTNMEYIYVIRDT
jgi:hypothetical protein